MTPTEAQQRYINELAVSIGVPARPVKTYEQASREIDRLKLERDARGKR